MDLKKTEYDYIGQAGETLASWIAPEYAHYEKSIDWYWWSVVVAIVFIGVAIWQRSFLFGVLIFLSWATIILYAMRPPHMIRFAITERGVIIEKKIYLWHDLKSFWIFYNPPLRKELLLESKKNFVSHIAINLGNEEPAKIRDILLHFLPEVEQQESLIDILTHLARF